MGDIDVDKTLAEIEKAFGGWKSGSVPPNENPPFRPEKSDRSISLIARARFNRQSTSAMSVFRARQRLLCDSHCRHDLWRVVLFTFDSQHSRKQRLHLFTFQLCKHTERRPVLSGGRFCAQRSDRANDPGDLYELDRMRVMPVTDEELNAAKEYSTGNFSVELASQCGLAGRINTVYTFDLSTRASSTTFDQRSRP